MNNKLEKVIVDPTHGGIDYGYNYNSVYEKDIILELSRYIKERLNQLEIKTILTRNEDITLSPSERINIIKNNNDDKFNVLVISNKLLNNNGANITYSINNNDMQLINNIKKQLEYEGLLPINTLQKTLPSDNAKDANFIQRELKNAQVIIIEYGNLVNKEDFSKISEELYKYGEAIVRAIAITFGYAYQEPININTNTHVVMKNESLYSIAKKYNTTINNIKSINNLKNNILSVGQIIKLPNTYTESSDINNNFIIYNIKKGDTLYNIAKKYNVEISDLINYNQLNNSFIMIGQQLLIPILNNNNILSITYIIKKGDTLYNIAKKYNTSVNEIMNLNNLNDNMITINDSLLIHLNKNNTI